jgi:hypothetical protein
MENIPKKYDNQNYYVSLMIFRTYKNVILRSVHSFGGSFDYDFTENLTLC